MHPVPPCASSEIYLIDAATFGLVEVNEAARANLGYPHAQLIGMPLSELARLLAPAEFAPLMAALGEETGAHVTLRTTHRRADGSSYPISLRFLRTTREGRRLILAIGEDRSAELALAAELAQYRERFDAIVSNTPGLVYQFVLHAGGAIAFPYLSEGCHALLGLPAATLQQRPELMVQLILPQDRASYLDAMRTSAREMAGWNWEGRIWIDAWKDVKWINLRATPRALRAPSGSVQWEGIMSNITESKLEHMEVERAHARLAELNAHTQRVKEQERTRIAREIHDDLGGNLTAIKMALAMLMQRLPPELPQLAERGAYVDALVDRSIDAAHRISLDLRPSMLDLGIVAALDWQVREFEKQAGISCHFGSNAKDIELSLDHATALFRIFQEALTNIAKHAQASRVDVRLLRLRHHIRLEITDNGVGLKSTDRNKSESFGLRNMQERAVALGGSMALAGAAGGGTVVTIRVRLNSPSTAAAAAPPEPLQLSLPILP